jgi:hypothetical protein
VTDITVNTSNLTHSLLVPRATQDRLNSNGQHAGLPNATEVSAPTKSQGTERILMESGIDDTWGFPGLPTVNSAPSTLFATIVPHISGRRFPLRHRSWLSCEQHGYTIRGGGRGRI